MRKKKKIESRYYIIIILFIITFFLGTMMYFIRDNRKLNIIEKLGKDSILTIQKIVSSPFHLVGSKINEIKEKNEVYKKYQVLLKESEQIELINAKNKELESELQEMKTMLELNQTLSETEYWNATVITRNIDGWYQTFTIDKGSSSGIKEGMDVVTDKGLLGRVIQTSNLYSTIKLLTSVDKENKVSVKIEGDGTFVYGLLSEYDAKTKQYKIEGIAENTNIQEGAAVITTGMGGSSPAGILIGTVSSIKTDHFDLARTVMVTPSVDFDTFRYVTVLKRKGQE